MESRLDVRCPHVCLLWQLKILERRPFKIVLEVGALAGAVRAHLPPSRSMLARLVSHEGFISLAPGVSFRAAPMMLGSMCDHQSSDSV